LLKDGVRS
jgi:hypothetical protein